ncbi:hypothetical protein H0H92_000823 [Tricholoma furcatifolium]|nr:hypothetical protein H0H92_000823 [Tricholoma furcatifolium]
MDLTKTHKWIAGAGYGPVLSQTDLYLLRCDLELHPILLGKASFVLELSLISGQVGGYNPESRDRAVSFSQKDEPATLPRVKQLYVVTECSPWCTMITNENGVTLNDICIQLYRDYSHTVTSAELNPLPPRIQELIRRHGTTNASNQANGWSGYYTPGALPPIPVEQIKRCDVLNPIFAADFLRERTVFEGLRKDDHDSILISRLGFKAPNIFIAKLSQTL